MGQCARHGAKSGWTRQLEQSHAAALRLPEHPAPRPAENAPSSWCQGERYVALAPERPL